MMFRKYVRKALTIILFCLVGIGLHAQGFSSIKKNTSYLWGEGRAADTHSADSIASAELLRKIAGAVDLPYEMALKISLMETFAEDLGKVSEFAVSGGRKETAVLRYIGRNAVGTLFDARRRRIAEMKNIAETAEGKLQMDVALRYWSWASMLMQSVPGFKSTDVAEARSRRVKILEGMNVRFDRQNVADRYVVELSFTYNGQPVRNIDYRFFNGKTWSGIMSAKDGKGFVEVSLGTRIDDYRILYESSPAHLQHIYREVRAVEKAFGAGAEKVGANAEVSGVNAVPSAAVSRRPVEEVSVSKIDFSKVKSKILDVMSSEKFNELPDSSKAVSMTPVLFTADYEKSVAKICDAVSLRDYSSVSQLFTPTGYDVFLRLAAYGNARVLSGEALNFYALGDEVYCRSVPMAFSFSGNRRQFVEDIVFTFNEKGLVSNLTFSLGKAATSDICSHSNWTEEARLILVAFLENYKTAYALKRLDYISSIFDNDALIITGRVVRSVGMDRSEYGSNRYVRFTQQNKETYIRNLSRVFASQEYINIQFSDSEVVKLGKGDQLFGIKIRQEYFSTTYSDVGYLFVLVDLSDYQAPVIHVRTWQDSTDKDFGIIGPYHF